MATGSSSRSSSAGSQGSRSEGWAAQFNALGGFIRSQRQMAKLSLREMASMTKVSNAYLSQVERGLHQPSLKVLHSIADALQLSTEQLLQQAGWASDPAAAGAAAAAAGPHGPTTVQGAAPVSGVEEAIAADGRLSEEQKLALLGVYRSFVEKSGV
jgi:transcriptional regulator with XRE-family HTH domain